MDTTHRQSPASLRARIAETRVRQWRVAQRLGVSEVHLSHVLVERKPADEAFLIQVADAIEAEAAQDVSS